MAAADAWDDVVHIKRVKPSMPGSIERVMHEVGLPLFALDLRRQPVRATLKVGVV